MVLLFTKAVNGAQYIFNGINERDGTVIWAIGNMDHGLLIICSGLYNTGTVRSGCFVCNIYIYTLLVSS